MITRVGILSEVSPLFLIARRLVRPAAEANAGQATGPLDV